MEPMEPPEYDEHALLLVVVALFFFAAMNILMS